MKYFSQGNPEVETLIETLMEGAILMVIVVKPEHQTDHADMNREGCGGRDGSETLC